MALNQKEYKKKQTPLFELRGYYESNRNNMKYNEYREKGWYIGRSFSRLFITCRQVCADKHAMNTFSAVTIQSMGHAAHSS